MRKLVLATRNRWKIREISAILDHLPLKVTGMEEYPSLPPVAEEGSTFAENAQKKALTVARFSGEMALADDSGLVVDELGGEPGVHSARFAGPGADDRANNALLLKRLAGVPPEKRQAAFHCAMVLAFPDGRTFLVEETCRGRILDAPRGEGGFGYDPLFFYEPTGMTFAEMDPAAKNEVSHRGKALRRMVKLLEELLSRGEL